MRICSICHARHVSEDQRQACKKIYQQTYGQSWYERNKIRKNAQAKARMEKPEARIAARAADRKHYWTYHEKVRTRKNTWLKLHPEYNREKTKRARARRINAPIVEKIDRKAIIARDHAICHLCGKTVQPKEMTLDHLVPLALRGNHTAANLAVAHLSCNIKKGTKAMREQLRLW